MRIRLTLVAIGMATLLCREAVAGTSGSMRGQVIDAETLEPLVGAHVIVVSPALPGERATVTLAQGRYLLDDLPPGLYSARFVFATVTTEHTDIRVRAGRRAIVNAQLSSAAVLLSPRRPTFLVDDTTGVGTHVDASAIANLPYRFRDIESLFDLTPSSVLGSVGGTTDIGSVVTINGLNTGDPAFRSRGARLVLEFVAELDVREGGWSAALGRSAGGIFNVVTKSGGNQLTGSVFSTVRPGAFAANPAYPPATGAWLAQRDALRLYTATGFELGGALVHDRLWFHVGYAPEIFAQRWTQRLRHGFAGGDAFDVHDTDDDGLTAEANGRPDGLMLDSWGRPITRPMLNDDTELQSLAVAHHFHTKLTHRINGHSSHSLTLFGAPTEFGGVAENPFDPRSPHASLNGDAGTFSFDGFTGNISGVYNYNGSFLEERIGLKVLLGWHHQERRYQLTHESNDPLVVYAQPRSLAAVHPDPLSSCGAGDLFDDGDQRCMVEDYAVGGFGGGILAGERLERLAERVALTHRLELAGWHALEAGFDFEQTELKSRRHIPGGGMYVYDRDRAVFSGIELLREGEVTAHSSARTASLDFAAYVQDSWNPAPEVTINYGLRWQGQQLFAPTADNRRRLESVLAITDSIAPRVGAAWDFLGDGRSRLFAHWGRFFVPIPLAVVDRMFGDIETRAIDYDSGTCVSDAGSAAAAANVVHPARQCAAIDSHSTMAGIAVPGLRAEHTDELLLGVELEPWWSWSFGVSGVYRSAGQSVAEIATEQGSVLANPGDFDVARLDRLDADIANARNQDERTALSRLRESIGAINGLPRSQRDLWGVRAVADKRLSERFALRASYFLSWSHGNTLGVLTDPIRSSMVNATGPLPIDRRHRIGLDGFCLFDARSSGVPLVSTVGASVRVISGQPIDVLGVDPATGAAVHLLPRGAGGRTPWIWSADLHLATRYHMDARFALELFVDLFNLFNRREPLAVVSTYTFDHVEPIAGGTSDDLDHARAADGQPVRVNPSHGEPLVFQAPFEASVGMRLLF